MERIQATPIAIEDAISRTNQRFWRVKLDTNDTLYTYQGSTISSIANVTPLVPGQPMVPTILTAQGQVCVFDVEQKGKYWHITASGLGGQPAAVVSVAAVPAPVAQAPAAQVPGTPVMAPGGYPASFDTPGTAVEQTVEDIATPQTMTPGFTQTPKTTPTGKWQSGGDGKNAGVCMSYAKDLAVAGRIQVDQLTTVAETMFNWVEAHK